MSRKIKKTVILLALEATIGTDAAPTGAANAFKAFDMNISAIESKSIEIPYLASYFGAAETLAGASYSKCSFSVSLSGSGIAGTAPAWAPAMICGAMSELSGLTVPPRVEYLPATDNLKTATIYWYDDGLLHKLVAAMCNVKLSAKAGEAPKLTFEFSGLHLAPTATSNVASVLTAWKPPVAIRKANVTDINLGCTYAAGALTGGTAFNSSGLTLDWGNKVDFTDLLSTEDVDISDRSIKGSFSLQLSAAEEAAQIANVETGTLQSMGFLIGTLAGNKIMLHAPAMRLTSHKKEDLNGKRMAAFDFQCTPVNGNDELRIVCL